MSLDPGRWFGRARRDTDAEIAYHLDRETEKNIARGLAPEEARRQASMRLGGVPMVQEACRDERPWRWIEWLFIDIRVACRSLARHPAYALLAVLTLALGLGANTAIFTVIEGVLVRSLPYGSGDRLVLLRQQAPQDGVPSLGVSVKELDDYRAHCRTLPDLVEYHQMSFILLGGPEADRVRTGVVSANFFDVLGVRALYGRTFQRGEDKSGADAVIVLSNEYFHRRFGGDRSVLGRVFRMNDRSYTVIGVLPPIPPFPDTTDVFMTTSACPFRNNPRTLANRQARMLTVFARRGEDVSVESARAEADGIARRFARENAEAYPRSFRADISPLYREMTESAKSTFLLLWGAAALVLCIACANVANMMLSRLFEREREMVIRTSLGAGRARLWGHLLTESMLLALSGGALGVLLAYLTRDALVAYASRFTPRASEIRVDLMVVVFAFGVAILTGLIAGVFGAGFTMRSSILRAGPDRQRLRRALVVCQVAFSFLLLAGAGLLIRSASKLAEVDPGYNAERVLTMNVMLNWTRYTTSAPIRAFHHTLLDKVSRLPGVVSAAVALRYPMDQSTGFSRNLQIEGQPAPEQGRAPRAEFRAVSPGYFQTIGQSILFGRAFTAADHENAPRVALVNQAMARRHWGGGDPVGRRFSLDAGRNWIAIVGVAGDVRQYGLDRAPVEEIYVPFAQVTAANSLIVRTTGDPMALSRSLRALVHEIDPENPVFEVKTLEDARRETQSPRRLTTALFGLFAAITLAITIAGIYGVMALQVSARTVEIGVRMALGAAPMAVLGGVMRQGLGLFAVGLAIGIAGALAATRFLTTLLYGIEPTDPPTFAAVAAVFALAAAAACWFPARRAATVDPIQALRAD